MKKQRNNQSIFIENIEIIDTASKGKSIAKHNGRAIFIKDGVPEGVDKFKSKFNKDAEYKFIIPGIYAYWCTPHKTMGMIGFVVVGDDKSNIEAIKAIRFSGKSKKIAPDLINQL